MSKLKTKTLIGIICIIICIGVLLVGSFSLLNATTESSLVSTTGTVDVSLANITLSNANNIIPGVNDPSVKNSTADHKLTYDISNVGTKSISTRQTILITVTDSENNFIDASYVKLLKNKNELMTKTYVLADGTETSTLTDGSLVAAVKYVFMGDSFDGSKNATILKDSEYADFYEIETETGDTTTFIKADSKGNVSQKYSFDLAVLKAAPSTYSDANINIFVSVEAMQYRDTVASDWTEASKVTRALTTGNIEIKTLPSYLENVDGQTISISAT